MKKKQKERDIKKNKRALIAVTLVVIFFLWEASLVRAETATQKLIVGTREVPPFAMVGSDGQWTGITIELLEKIGEKLDLSYEYKPLALSTMFDELQSGTIDMAAAAISITSEREGLVDFTHPFYQSGLGIAVVSKPAPTWWGVMTGLVSWQFIKALGILALILFIFGFFVWLFERRKNQDHFGGGAAKGIGSGFWWAAVTMTTVGYGDKYPVTLAGRLVALVWMFTGIIIISSITAAITSALTVASLDSGIQGPKDLPRVSVGIIAGTTSEEYFSEQGMRPQRYNALPQALEALSAGEIEALVYDAPILSYFINQHYPGKLVVLPRSFEPQYYGIALPINSVLRKDINQEILFLIESGELERIKRRYLGGV